ncbi:MAG TPA: hypothetical protein PKE63_01780, partial [Lacibacter sp.]|nr:hypothetical protein [Lacibacter sp.]
ILSQVREQEERAAALLSVPAPIPPLAVPDGYFENLDSQVLAAIRKQKVAAEISSLSPLLAEAGKRLPYSVPDGYFNQLPERWMDELRSPRQEARVVNLFSRRTWVRFAAAASVLLLLATAAFYLGRNPVTDQSPVAMGLQLINNDAFDQALAQVETTALVHYLQSISITPEEDAELMAVLLQDEELPAEAELLDEEFLNSYLETLEQPETVH